MRYFVLIVYLLVISTGCKDEMKICEDSCYSGESEGFFIVNEGPFQRGSGTISFYNSGKNKICNRLYERANCGDELGNIVQSMEFYGDDAFIVVNNSDKIIVADKNTFKFKKMVDGIVLPRYFLPYDRAKAFVSYWGDPGGIAVVDLENYSVKKRILTGSGAEKMVRKNDKIYIVNSGGFGRDSTVVVVDAVSESVLKTIVVGDNPNSLQIDKDGAIWLICAGYTDWSDPDSLSTMSGKLVKIVDDVVVNEFEVEKGGKNLVVDQSGEKLYFTTGGVTGKVYRVDIEHIDTGISLFYDYSFYSLGFDKEHNQLLGADCKDFNSAGEIFIIDGVTGNLKNIVFAGLIPGNIVFRED